MPVKRRSSRLNSQQNLLPCHDILDLVDYHSESAMLDSVHDHELDALLKVLEHNLLINGCPIEDDDEVEENDHQTEAGEDGNICYVDCMGQSYFKVNNCQYLKTSDPHKHISIHVIEDTEVPTPKGPR